MAVLYLVSGKLEPEGPGRRRGSGRLTRERPDVRTIQINGGRVIDPSQDIDRVADLWLSRGRVLAIGEGYEEAEVVIDAAGLIVCPGLIDMHVHLREPGREEDETIATGTAAALAGGVTSVACMPNTEPALDSQAAAEFVILQAQRAGKANVFPIGAVTKGRKGEELAEIGGLVDGGAVAFTDDGAPVASAEIMRRALEYAKMFDRVIMQHCQVLELTDGGVMNEGFESMRLGLPGMPAAAEDIMIARDIGLAELTGGRLHILHVSTAAAVELIREGKRRGVRVTGEACPHHFTLTDERLRTFDSNYKMSPPLRTWSDVEAIIGGLQGRHARGARHRPRPARPREEDARARPGPERHRRPGDPDPDLRARPDRAGPPDLAGDDRQADGQPGAAPGHPQGTLRPGADADVTVIDPEARGRSTRRSSAPRAATPRSAAGRSAAGPTP